MKRILLFSLFCCLFSGVKAQIVSLNTAEVSKLKNLIKTDENVKKQYEALLKTADESLTAIPNPADTILTEGILQGNPRKTKTWTSLEDMQKIYALAFAYKIEGDKKYIDKASEFFMAWAKGNTPTGSPINDTNLDRIIFAFDLVRDDLKGKVVMPMELWLEQVAIQEIKSYDKASKGQGKTHFNNWNSHRIKEVAQVAWVIKDGTLQSWVLNAYKSQISKNLLPDGSSFDFHERDALHYHIYDVDPLMVAATIIARGGNVAESPYLYQSAEGSSLKKSLDWLVPFFTGEKTHAEWVNSKSAFDKKRAANGEKGYIAGTLFKPVEARSSIALANYFDPQMLIIYQQQAKNNSKYPNWQFVLNEIKR